MRSWDALLIGVPSTAFTMSPFCSRFLRRRTVGDLGDQRALIAFPGREIGCKIADGNADLAATNFAVLNKLLHDPASHVDRDGEPDSDVTAARRNDCRVDPDELSPEVY